jgi:hypothetical protein
MLSSLIGGDWVHVESDTDGRPTPPPSRGRMGFVHGPTPPPAVSGRSSAPIDTASALVAAAVARSDGLTEPPRAAVPGRRKRRVRKRTIKAEEPRGAAALAVPALFARYVKKAHVAFEARDFQAAFNLYGKVCVLALRSTVTNKNR